MTKPEFTVIVPTRARPDLLREALASVSAQTITDFECLVIDDGTSTAVAVMPADERFRLIEVTEPVGVSEARNVGAREAQGTALCFLDDDDHYLPNRLELARTGLSRAPLALCWSETMAADGQPTADGQGASGRTLEGKVGDVLFDTTLPHLGLVSVRKDAFQEFDQSFVASGDLEWWLRMRDTPMATVPEVGYRWRRHGAVRQGNPPEARIAANLRLLRDHADYFGTHRAARSFRYYRLGIMNLQASNRKAAVRCLARSLVTRPSLRAGVTLVRALLSPPSRLAEVKETPAGL